MPILGRRDESCPLVANGPSINRNLNGFTPKYNYSLPKPTRYNIEYSSSIGQSGANKRKVGGSSPPYAPNQNL